MNKNVTDSGGCDAAKPRELPYIRRDEEENSTDAERSRERTGGERFLREAFGTGLGVLCEEHSVAPAITV